MRVIEITESKREKLSHNVEKALKYMGKVMQCVESLEEDDDMGYRENDDYGYRGRMGERYPMGRRHDREDWDDDDDMGERRRRYRR